MGYQFTDDDRGKDVVTHDGTRVGTVDNVNNDRATVNRSDNDNDDGGLTDSIKDMLGWNDDDQNQEIRDEHVDSSDDDRIHLRQY